MLINGAKAEKDRDALLKQIENLPASVYESVSAIKLPQSFLDNLKTSWGVTKNPETQAKANYVEPPKKQSFLDILKSSWGFTKNPETQAKANDIEKEPSNSSEPVNKKINTSKIDSPPPTPRNNSSKRPQDKSRGR